MSETDETATMAEIVQHVLGDDVPLPAIKNALVLIGVRPSDQRPEVVWHCDEVAWAGPGARCTPGDFHGGGDCGWRAVQFAHPNYVEALRPDRPHGLAPVAPR